MLTHKFRLYPSKTIEQKLLETLEICRRGYNTFLGELNEQKEIDKSQIQGIIPDMKICDEQFSKVHSKTLQYECYKLFSNLQGLSKSKGKRKIGQLRFKGKGVFKTFTYNQMGFKLVNTGKRCQTLWLSKIGNIPVRCHRQITGKAKQVTIKHFPSGKWFAFVIEDGNRENQYPRTNKVVGIDFGLIDTVYDSDGNSVTNPKHLKQKEKRLKQLQRMMSNKIKRSNNRDRFRIMLARHYEKLTNSRDDFLHKLSDYYVKNYDVIAMEHLAISNMAKGCYSKSILDACWGKLRQFISYKAESADKIMMLVNPAGTSQRCSQCAEIVQKGLGERIHSCRKCGFIVPRDYNSALEIKRLCLEKIRQELPEYKHLEMEALPIRQLLSMKNEAPCES